MVNGTRSHENNQNIVWDNGAYSPITKTRSYGIASNEWEFSNLPEKDRIDWTSYKVVRGRFQVE